jgi:hypothetical protein
MRDWSPVLLAMDGTLKIAGGVEIELQSERAAVAMSSISERHLRNLSSRKIE